MKKRTLKALAMGVAMTTAMMMGAVCTYADEAEETTDAAEEEAAAEETSEQEGEEDTAEETEASKDQAILVVSFGTSYNDSRDVTIGAIENAIAEAFPEFEVRRAFTSQIIIDKLEERDGLDIDNVTEALDRAVEDGVKTLVVQPTHLMNGLEYTDLSNELAEYADQFDKVVMGEPLLTSDEDFESVITAITDYTKDYDDGETAICFMGHGTEAESNGVYAKLQDMLTEGGYENYYVGTVEATPTLEDVLAKVGESEYEKVVVEPATASCVKSGEYKKVVLEPLMVVAGDHANNDMAGDEEGSWKTEFEAAGYEVECVIHGLGEIEGIQQIYVDHTQAAVDSLAE